VAVQEQSLLRSPSVVDVMVAVKDILSRCVGNRHFNTEPLKALIDGRFCNEDWDFAILQHFIVRAIVNCESQFY